MAIREVEDSQELGTYDLHSWELLSNWDDPPSWLVILFVVRGVDAGFHGKKHLLVNRLAIFCVILLP